MIEQNNLNPNQFEIKLINEETDFTAIEAEVPCTENDSCTNDSCWIDFASGCGNTDSCTVDYT